MLLAPATLVWAAVPLGLMLLGALALVRFAAFEDEPADGMISLELQSPFSLRSALKFGLIFLAMAVIGTVASAWLGQFGFYAVSVVGGFVSSASAVAM